MEHDRKQRTYTELIWTKDSAKNLQTNTKIP